MHYHVGATGEDGVVGSHISGIDRGLARRVFRSVDKTDQIAVVEITKAMHFVDRRNCPAEPGHDLSRQLETEVHTFSANVKNEIARCSHGMT